MTSFSIFRQHSKYQEKFNLSFEYLRKYYENEAMEQMIHFPYFFQIHDISKVLKGFSMRPRVKCLLDVSLFRPYSTSDLLY